MTSTPHNQHALRIDARGLRRRVKNLPEHIDNDDRKEVVYLRMQEDTPWPKWHCVVYIGLWILSLITALFYLQHTMCSMSKGLMNVKCKSPDYIFTPVLMDHVTTPMKRNHRVKSKTSTALMEGRFDQTAIWKKHLYSIAIDPETKTFVNNNEKRLNIHISAIVYSDQYHTRIGEVAFPLTALYYENCIDQMVIIDDTEHHKSTELWEQQILFDNKLPSEQLKVKKLEEHMQARYHRWDTVHDMKRNKKQLIRTSNIGKWRGFEIGSRLGYVPRTEQTKTNNRNKNDIELLLFLDTYHQLPFNDEWITNALALFDEYPNLQVLGGFNGVIKSGKTFGDVNVADMRTENMDKEAKVFVMSRQSDYYKQMGNKRKYDESRVNIVELMDKYKEEYFDRYWKSFWDKAKEYTHNDFDGDGDDDGAPVGLFSMNFLDDFDKAVFLNENDADYDEDKVQTGYEGIQFIMKKRFLEKYEAEIEKRLPISAKLLKKINDRRKLCIEIVENGNPTEKQQKECDMLLKAGGQTVMDYYFIPYEQRINAWNVDRMEQEIRWIPFMFVTSVRMGPIFIRRDWWFDKLLPHVTELEDTMGDILNKDWLDVEISLYTWCLGGYVGLYDAEGFRFDRDNFVNGLNRNRESDEKWDMFQLNHHLVTHNKDWDVWNVSHLVELNEHDTRSEGKLRLRTSIGDTSDNPAHPTALENSRQIMLTMQTFEKWADLLDNDQNRIYDIGRQYDENMMRLKNVQDDDIHKVNPLN